MESIFTLYICACVAFWGPGLVTGSKVLLVSMDGFRWDYIERARTPNFTEFAKMGSRAEYLTGVFSSKTFPSHYTIATGLYEENHGIVGNYMYDPTTQRTFSPRNAKENEWWGGEPIWVTARRQSLKTAVYNWAGSEAEIMGYRPNFYTAYNKSIPFSERLDTVIEWLTNTSFAVELVLLHFQEPDSTGHDFGPYGAETLAKVEEMDGVLEDLVSRFDAANLWSSVNVIVTSDHGMANTSDQRMVDILDYVDHNAIKETPTLGAVVNLLVMPDMRDEVYRNLSKAPHMSVYMREDVPTRFHFSNNPRILDINASEYWYASDQGGHGYDNELMSMKPIFYARGPDIKVGYTSATFNLVDIYPLVCELLNVTAAPNNGSLDVAATILNRPVSEAVQERSNYVFWLLVLFVSSFCNMH
ncbi:ENPP4-like protein [Mya arenaria]|uniref:ENPP4-like protein n=1 Tax=Mya arenaria TaxID=6604 RepID=A0ABY7FML7_MYAAR|nr:ENPP4-like protein [Mya arenaria]